MDRKWLNLLSAAFMGLVLAPAHAATMRTANAIETSAEAIVEVPADLALLDFGVTTQAESAATASSENARRMDAVLAAVRKVAGNDARINTGAYSIRPVYATQRDGGSPRVTGYAVSNTVHLRTPALARVGDVIDAAVKAGANQVQRLAFTIANDEAPRREALGSAVVKARDKAQTIAGTLGVKLGPVLSVVEQEVGVVRPLRQAMTMAAETAPVTPVEPGQVEVRARVVLMVEIAR